MKSSISFIFTIAASALLAITIACASAPASPGTGDKPLIGADPTPTPSQNAEPVFVETLAPIENAVVQVAESFPPQYFLLVTSGLPNGCARFDGYEVTRDGEDVRVRVTNLMPADTNVACTDNYRTVETKFLLAADIEPCKVYTVDVNGESRRVQAIGAAIRCEAPTEIPSSQGTIEVLAPIEGVKVQVAKSFPPQYSLLIRSAQPNGCARFNDSEVTRDGYTIRVKVTNLIPADPDVICTQVYSVVENSVALGSDFKPGVKYTAIVNDVTETFVAQGTSEPPQPTRGSRFEVALGQAVTIGPDGLQIQFLEVTEDSRCPTDVVCVQAGQAAILVGISGGGQPPSLQPITL